MQGRNKLIKILLDANKNQKDSFTLGGFLGRQLLGSGQETTPTIVSLPCLPLSVVWSRNTELLL